MKRAILFVRRHDAQQFEVYRGPGAFSDVNTDFRKLLGTDGIHSEFAEAQFWTSDTGLDRSLRFIPARVEKVQAETASDETAMSAQVAATKRKGFKKI